MRIDRFLSDMGVATRSEAARAAKRGEITVDGRTATRADAHIDPDKNVITYRGDVVPYKKHIYIMLNKPDGYVSATEDGRDPTVLELLPESVRKRELFPCGRLDKHTTGLMLITDDGELSHRLLSPKNHVKKKYLFTSKFPLSREDEETLERGVELDDGYLTKPCEIEMTSACGGAVAITEGKYHQIKRMFESVGNKITSLERIGFGELKLDEALSRGEWRYLGEEEIKKLEEYR